jgi:hypothetical protein
MEFKNMQIIKIIGKRYGKLTIVGFSHKNDSRQQFWNCKCDCGNEKTVNSFKLKTGKTKSCGCNISPPIEIYHEKKRKLLKSKIIVANTCWIWTGQLHPRGYGITGYRKTKILTHRLSYLLFNGNIPYGMYVCHTCDNRRCINPEHLWLGNQKDNMKDMIIKDRHVRGERAFFSKLKDYDVIKIRNLFNDLKSYSKISKLFNVGQRCIKNIILKKTWKHI